MELSGTTDEIERILKGPVPTLDEIKKQVEEVKTRLEEFESLDRIDEDTVRDMASDAAQEKIDDEVGDVDDKIETAIEDAKEELKDEFKSIIDDKLDDFCDETVEKNNFEKEIAKIHKRLDAVEKQLGKKPKPKK